MWRVHVAGVDVTAYSEIEVKPVAGWNGRRVEPPGGTVAGWNRLLQSAAVIELS